MIREAAKRALDRPKKITAQWIMDDYPLPPPHYVKQMLVTTFALINKHDTLVETGTYLGDMVEAQREYFKKIYSIELSEKLAENARQRFKQYPHIEIIQGDSGQRLAEIVSRLNGPALFWLDGHYSGGETAMGSKECPALEELQAIKSSPYPHTVIIDDHRSFVQDSYPAVEELEALAGEKFVIGADAMIWQKRA